MADNVNKGFQMTRDLSEKVEKRWRECGFKSLSAYLRALVLTDMEGGTSGPTGTETAPDAREPPSDLAAALRKELAAVLFVLAATAGRADLVGSSEKAITIAERYLAGEFYLEE